MNDVLLEARGVSKSFNGVSALRDGRISLRAGSVHALCGGNGAGKSTFLNILMGLLRRDGGSIHRNGGEVNFANPGEALSNGMAIITQELSPVLGMTVAENLFLGREPTFGGFIVNYRTLRKQAQTLLDRLGFAIDAGKTMNDLSLAQIQLVEIAKAFSYNCQVMIMDEPTSAIGERETETLFNAIRSVSAKGAGIIYVSHRLSELTEIADEYTILRDGAWVESGKMANVDRTHLVRGIVGRALVSVDKEKRPAGDTVALNVDRLSRQNEFTDVCLQVRHGEILGIYGLMGSGRSEFINCVYGLTVPDRGSILLDGKPLPPGNPSATIRAGISIVTEDRKDTGLVLTGSVRENIAMAAYPRLSNFSWISGRKERALADEMIAKLNVKTASQELAVSSMSGGNQQKVVLAKCLSTGPMLLLCDEPTRGIDEGAKQEIYKLLDQFVRAGGAVIVVSSESPELLYLSDRIAVFKGGRIVATRDEDNLSQETLLHLAS